MYNVVLIDDEEDGIIVLNQFLKNFTSFNINICGTADNLQDGVKLIKKEEPEIVFLDIDMPNENGLAIFNYFDSPQFKIIFVTAHKQYAIDALNNAATGYLLKPVNFIDLKDILQKSIKKIEAEQQVRELEDKLNVLHASNKDDQSIMLETQNGFVMESLNNIEYCYANQSYSIIVLHTKKEIVLSRPLKSLVEEFPDDMFYRTHKSYLVNISYMRKFTKGNSSNITMRGGTKIPVSVRTSKTIVKDIKAMLVKK